MYHNFWQMDGGRVIPHTATTGFFGNLFLFGETDAEATFTLNAQAQTMLESDRAPTLSDSQAILKLAINPPLGEKCLANFLRMHALVEVLLPKTHVFRVRSGQHTTTISPTSRVSSPSPH